MFAVAFAMPIQNVFAFFINLQFQIENENNWIFLCVQNEMVN